MTSAGIELGVNLVGIVARLGSVCALGLLFVLAAPTATAAQDAEFVIETQITFSGDAPPSGTFAR